MAKAGRPKKGSAGLPGWFDITCYRSAIDYRAMAWHRQLGLRFIFHEQLYGKEFNRKIADVWLHTIAAGPQIDTEQIHDAFLAHGISKPVNEFISTIETPGAELMRRFITVDDPVYGVKVMDNKAMNDVTMGYPIIPEGEIDKKTWGREPFCGIGFLTDPGKRYMEVDFRLPIALLKKQFTECLETSLRDIKKTIGPFFKNQDFSAWHNSGVLPYLDLMLWEKASGQTFRWSAFVNALNSITTQPIGSGESCRKTVKALAAKLMTENALFILSFQTHKKLGNERKKSGKLFVK